MGKVRAVKQSLFLINRLGCLLFILQTSAHAIHTKTIR